MGKNKEAKSNTEMVKEIKNLQLSNLKYSICQYFS